MPKNTVEAFVRWITPLAGDPTYSLLKAHLLFEELLRAYIARMLPHAEALQGGRFSFSQLLLIAKASSIHAEPGHWVWRAMSELNKIRNMLSHESAPKDISIRLERYAKISIEGCGVPLPAADSVNTATEDRSNSLHRFTRVEMATVGLYYYTASLLGFNVESILDEEERRSRELGVALVAPAPDLPTK